MFRRAVTPLLALMLVVGGVGLWVPAGAAASAYSAVEQAYLQSVTGVISPCEFSSAELEAALKQAPAYDFQYGAEVSDAIQAALAARADGECRSGHPAAGGGGASGAGGPGSGGRGVGARVRLKGANTTLPGSVGSASAGGLPLVLVVAFGLAGLCVLALGTWLGLNALGYDPGFGRAARHSLREAEYRMSAGWEDLTDRLRR